ncbi:putative D-cysteine desulfhydrase 1, mitochondrial [Cucurbita argyrosperma subsp. argyrosperma]|nr:putative D-cysteine desulfhydrase 1, mitochondrial [Cucurbita argyrosperma subsp. argyrosperma]
MKLRPITNTMEITTPEISKKKKEENDVVPESLEFLTVRRYAPPSWASHLNHIPTHFSSLGHFTTPIHKWNLPNLPKNTHVWIKREDLCGMQLSGNKVRKLEFFIADALQQGADCIITAGFVQSNHCRATAVAAKYFNLDSYLILFTSKALVNEDPGLKGNLLVERLVGAQVELAPIEDLKNFGSVVPFTDCLKSTLLAEGRKPYVIPAGGSNTLGNWGYIEATREIEEQLNGTIKFDDIVVACGSGGTLVGLSLGSWLSTLKAKAKADNIGYWCAWIVTNGIRARHRMVSARTLGSQTLSQTPNGASEDIGFPRRVHGFSIFDNAHNYFHDLVQRSLDSFGVSIDWHDIVEVHQAKGLGYAMNTCEELHFIKEVAQSTGIVLDPVYSGKAAYGMMKEMSENPSKWEGRKVLFIHTGGLLGMYGKVHEFESILSEKWRRLDDDLIVPPIDDSLLTAPSTNSASLSLSTSTLFPTPSPAMEMKAESKKNDEVLSNCSLLSVRPYVAPSWASHLNPIPTHFSSLAHWNLPNLPNNTEVWLKGMQMSGNKVRKLEFLIADALQQGADCIITIGAIQSNHCRATAVAAKYFNLDTYLILSTSKALVNQDPGLTGNLLFERLVGANVELVSEEECKNLKRDYLKSKLVAEGRKPYVIPIGGSNSHRTWYDLALFVSSSYPLLGYIEAIREIERQLDTGIDKIKFDDIVEACGSGSTVAGLALGSWLSTLKAKIRAFSVCYDPDYFHKLVQGLLDGLHAGVDSHDIVEIQDAKCLGYAISTPDELNFVKEVPESTGVVLDPVYSGKAAYGMMIDMSENPKKWEGRKILFIHTGGLLGLYAKADQLGSMLGKCSRLDVNECVPRINGVRKMF